MDGEQKMWSIISTAIVALVIVMIALGARSCDIETRERAGVFKHCLDAGKQPIECSTLRP